MEYHQHVQWINSYFTGAIVSFCHCHVWLRIVEMNWIGHPGLSAPKGDSIVGWIEWWFWLHYFLSTEFQRFLQKLVVEPAIASSTDGSPWDFRQGARVSWRSWIHHDRFPWSMAVRRCSQPMMCHLKSARHLFLVGFVAWGEYGSTTWFVGRKRNAKNPRSNPIQTENIQHCQPIIIAEAISSM